MCGKGTFSQIRSHIQSYVYIHADEEVDGFAFMRLTEGDIKEMIPKKIGIVKRLSALQEEVSFFFSNVVCISCSLA